MTKTKRQLRADSVPTCPHCGGDEFYVIIDQRNSTSFRLGFNKRGEKDALDIERMYGSHVEYRRVYCFDCQKPVFNRYDLEKAGWPIPI